MIVLYLWFYDKFPLSWNTTLIGMFAGLEGIIEIMFIVWNISMIMESVG